MSTMELLQPVDNAFRDSFDLRGNWFFAFDKTKDKTYETGVARQMSVPVPAALQDLFVSPEERTYCGTMWYERSVFVPKRWLGSDVFLRFDGIGNRAVVYVNGMEAGRHEGAFITTVLNVTRQLRYGEDNRIVVKVNNELSAYSLPAGQVITSPKGRRINQPNFDYDVPSGIYGNVTLYTVPTTRLTDAMVQTVELSAEKAVVQYMAHVQGNCLVTATLRDREGRIAATGVGGNAKLVVENPHIWIIGEGYLYTLELEVSRLGKQHDMYALRIGIRTVAIESGNFTLNGTVIRLKGRQFTGLDGQLTTNLMQAKQQLLQVLATGGNCIFSNGRPLAPEILQLADECGVLVVAEMPAAGLQAKDLQTGEANFSKSDIKSRLLDTHKETIDSLITRDKNHPSIVSWSLLYNPLTMLKEDETYYKDIAEAALQSDWEHRPLALTFKQPLSQIWTSNLNSYSLLLLATWSNQWQMDGEILQSLMYKELVDWQAKQPDKAMVVLVGIDNQELACGAGRTATTTASYVSHRETSEKVKAILMMLSSMPNVQGQFLQSGVRGLENVVAERWK
ncbi:sugar-binding domain-containing protein [Veillonella sp. R32]|uniref:sugar-binding domain-containing protein n=1 Tax=Veillonella sp. R32 TaxID=2021312 RepID=UPI0013898A8A|nr:sugar-binding domain-containing protein [Veillonella sp. R32]KAF1681447.1 hypothetical protein VER_07840 [Veillonella sp. R32]